MELDEVREFCFRDIENYGGGSDWKVLRPTITFSNYNFYVVFFIFFISSFALEMR